MPRTTAKHHPQPPARTGTGPEHVLKHAKKEPYELTDDGPCCLPYGHWVKSGVREHFPLNVDQLNKLVEAGVLTTDPRALAATLTTTRTP